MHLVRCILFGIHGFSDYMFLAGRSGAGKSFLLLQAVEYCAQSDWVVIYIPRGVSSLYALSLTLMLISVFSCQSCQLDDRIYIRP
jgi:hypothetical protein